EGEGEGGEVRGVGVGGEAGPILRGFGWELPRTCPQAGLREIAAILSAGGSTCAARVVQAYADSRMAWAEAIGAVQEAGGSAPAPGTGGRGAPAGMRGQVQPLRRRPGGL